MCRFALGTRYLFALLLATAVCSSATWAQPVVDTTENVTNDSGDAEWIWTAAHSRNEVPVGDCFFRKSFRLATPESGEVQITADNRFELLVNGQPVGQGGDWRQIQVYDISKHLRKGRNSIAVRVTNTDQGAAGLVARVLVREEAGTFESFSTDGSWRTSVRRYQGWATPDFPDGEWVAATSYGLLGATLPWGDEVVLAGEGARFEIDADFVIERLMRDEEVGSLIAMTFDSAGNILASREGGHLLLLSDNDHNGAHETVGVFCDKIRNVQGLLALGTRVLAVGEGPEGVALYRLRDADRDGVAEEIKSLVPIVGSKGEHGAHAVRLGPDGLLYVILGNHARLGRPPDARSPYRNSYEGDLVQPRQEDPQGHAVGIPAPGGTIFRTDTVGSFVEVVAGGLRNSYDLAFSPDGELFTYDADMEWDRGAPWYRPTRVNHITAGAELGWRSGWAKWPSYYLDSLPATIHVGPGSPTGMEFYDHTAFPQQYRGAMFGCDWATGRIYAMRFERQGATVRGQREVFVAGRPLNATDIAVGPDGALYFCTGGRGTDGGIYRVRWDGEIPADHEELGEGIERALRQPQLDADWARAAIATVKSELGDDWAKQLNAVARDLERSTTTRQRALDLMVLFAPRPTERLLLDLSHDAEPRLRAKAASLLYAIATPPVSDRLVELLGDPDALVRRTACETLTRQRTPAPAAALVELLADDDRFVAFAARRALEQLPPDRWAQTVLDDPRINVFTRGAVALLATQRGATAARAVLNRCEQALAVSQSSNNTQLDNQQLVDLLRIEQLALLHENLSPHDLPQLGPTLLSLYPSGNARADRELVRLLVHLQAPGAAAKFADQLQRDLPTPDKLHIAAYASALRTGWETDSKLALLKFYEEARAVDGGYSVSAYVENFAREFFTNLTLRQRRQVLANAQQWPTSALSVLAKLPADPGGETLAELRALDERVAPSCADRDDFRRLRVGILAVLARSGEQESMEYLRSIYRDEPAQRNAVAVTLTQHPTGENWAYLVDALKTVDGRAAHEVLISLTQVQERPRQPEAYRQVILLGLRLGEDGAEHALRLLDHWSGRRSGTTHEDWQDQLAGWQQWYAKHFPDAPPAEMPADSGQDKWSYEELVTYLDSDAARNSDAARGADAFAAAGCFKCHRCGARGEALGPDLTTVARRFQRKEILESIIYPSHVISDQYAARVVVSNGRAYAGLVVPRRQDGVTVLLADGEKIEFAHEEIDEIKPSATSSMPAGLLNALSLQQVADLFVYLEQADTPAVAQKQVPQNR